MKDRRVRRSSTLSFCEFAGFVFRTIRYNYLSSRLFNKPKIEDGKQSDRIFASFAPVSMTSALNLVRNLI